MARNDRTMELDKIIRPLPDSIYQADFSWSRIVYGLADMGYGRVDFEPDFQRGHVWTPDQQRAWIENVIRGVIPSSGLVVQFNCPNWSGWEPGDKWEGELPTGLQCIDGLQRITASEAWLDGTIKPFGLSLEDFEGTSYQPDRVTYRFHVAIYNFTTRRELLQHYLDLNSGGTVHSEHELERVARLMGESKC